MRKIIWTCFMVGAALLAGCARDDAMPSDPYDPLRVDQKDIMEMELLGATSGHTIDARVKESDVPIKIHVADVMAPLKGQPWSSEATAALDALVKGKHARVKVFQSFREPNVVSTIGRVNVDGKDIGWQLVGNGNAWVWESKSNDKELKKLQAWAQQHKMGLWALPESQRQPPWQVLDERVKERLKEPGEKQPEQ